jgi:hypothetical protein
MSRDKLTEQITELLKPYIGPHMARAAVDAHASKLGLDLDHLDRGGLDALAEHIALGLHVFIGKEKSEQVSSAFRRLKL